MVELPTRQAYESGLRNYLSVLYSESDKANGEKKQTLQFTIQKLYQTFPHLFSGIEILQIQESPLEEKVIITQKYLSLSSPRKPTTTLRVQSHPKPEDANKIIR